MPGVEGFSEAGAPPSLKNVRMKPCLGTSSGNTSQCENPIPCIVYLDLTSI